MRHASKARMNGDTTRAHAFYSRAVELKPDDAQGWLGWSATAEELDDAILGWGHALALNPQDLGVRDSLHDAIVNKIELDGKDQSESFLALGRQLAQMGLRHYAHRLLVRATELAPQLEAPWLWRGGTTEDSSEMARCLERVLEINPKNDEARAGLRWTMPQKRTPATASLAKQDMIEVMKEGRRAFGAGDQTRAHELFLLATELAPNDPQAWFWRGSLASDTAEAIQAMDQVLRLDPGHAVAKESRWVLRIRQLRATNPKSAVRKKFAPAPDRDAATVEVSQDDETTDDPPPVTLPRLTFLLIGAALILLVAVLAILMRL